MSSRTVEVGDIFNETSEDEMWQVNEIRANHDPPTAMCSKIQDGSEESEDTEEEYDLPYVTRCVDLRKHYEREGFASLDAKGIYKLSKNDLLHAMALAKQTTAGLTKTQLRDRMLLHNGFAQVPESQSSDDESDSESSEWEEEPETGFIMRKSVRKNQTSKNKKVKCASDAASATVSLTTDEHVATKATNGKSSGEKSVASAKSGAKGAKRHAGRKRKARSAATKKPTTNKRKTKNGQHLWSW